MRLVTLGAPGDDENATARSSNPGCEGSPLDETTHQSPLTAEYEHDCEYEGIS
jgi:hypothetical protein